MPIKPPNLDDRRYADIVAESQKLIPQYCPEWTNFSAADPGMTLVQLFAWMTELIIYRLNKVPDKTYIHFLNFIGEERKAARPAVAPVTFTSNSPQPVEVRALSTCSTKQTENKAALYFMTVQDVTVHSSLIEKVMVIKKQSQDALVREIPFVRDPENPAALVLNRGKGIQIFDIDPVEYGPLSYTPHQYIYIAHDDFRLMNIDPSAENPLGRVRMRSAVGQQVSIVDLFSWEYPVGQDWFPVSTVAEDEKQFGIEEKTLITSLPGISEYDFQVGNIRDQLSDEVRDAKWWIRGRLDYERWLVMRMQDDMHVYWHDDRGGEKREIYEWTVRSSGRMLEFALQDLPPIKAGWNLQFEFINRHYPAGRNRYLPKYRWYYRRREIWEEIPAEQVRIQQTKISLIGPLADMATDGINLRAERIESVFIKGFCRDLELDLTWVRPVEISLMQGEDPRRAEPLSLGEAPFDPFQLSPVLPPTIGRRLFIGSDLFNNRKQQMVTLEIEYGFEMNGELIEEPTDLYALQLTYRAEDSWRVVWTKDKKFTKFVFNDLLQGQEPVAARQKVTIRLDPKENMRGLAPYDINGFETSWLRLELIKANLTGNDEEENQHPIRLRLFDIDLGFGTSTSIKVYEEPMLSPRVAQVDFRPNNLRLTKVDTRAIGRSREFSPFYPFVDIDDGNQSLYLQFDQPLPVGSRHTIHFRCRGEAFLPSGIGMEWELLEERGGGRSGWKILQTKGNGEEGGDIRPSYALNRTGVLEFPLPEIPRASKHGFWLRGRFVIENQDDSTITLPPFPPITHVMLNTVNTVNLHTVRTERYSGQGIPNQQISLLRSPIFQHNRETERPIFERPELFPDIRVVVDNEEGEREEWDCVSDAEMLVATKDAKCFTLDPVEGVLTFGNGIRARMLPVGSNNVLIDIYHVVPGAKGNVGPEEISLCDFNPSLNVSNLLPASGGKDAETIDEIIRRAPSLLTTRDRAVTAIDFETIAKEASSEVSRAYCNGLMDEDGQVEIVILPNRREGEKIPDPFLSGGLRSHVSGYLTRRCLINVQPLVRLAKFMTIDIRLYVRLRVGANLIQVREAAEDWTLQFLDPYHGGLDKQGWPFGGTLYAQDFARMVSDIPEVRHITRVSLFDMSATGDNSPPGWEEGTGSEEFMLEEHDLFVVRRISVVIEDGRS